LSGRGLCDELITRPEESYRLWCVVVCDLETSRIGAPYIYDISNLRVNIPTHASIIYTLKGTKFTFKHLKTQKFAPTCFGPFLRPSSGGSWTVLYAVTKLRSVDVHSL